jgi:hypothetical protein
MNQKFISILIFCAATFQVRAQSSRIDTVAVSILDRMSAMIGDLASCSVNVRSNYDIHNKELGLVKHSDEEQLFLRGPNKLLFKSEGDHGGRDFFYNGQTLSYYSQDKNQYGQIQTPASTIVDMIDTVNKLYGIEFPVADFFYPSFVDDILADSKNLVFLGLTKVNGKECFHIAGTAPDKTFQFWIANDAYSLPLKVVIVYTARELNPQFEAVLSDWQINPSLPDALFEFAPPTKAKKVKLVPHSIKK